MGIETFIQNALKQKAVYWGNPVNDGTNNFTFDTPVEIDCRWQDKAVLFVGANGEQDVSRSIIYTIDDLVLNGYLYLGTLDELYDVAESSAYELNPKEIDNAFIIKNIDKSPSMNIIDNYTRKVYL
jgi:hypothetical protein